MKKFLKNTLIQKKKNHLKTVILKNNLKKNNNFEK